MLTKKVNGVEVPLTDAEIAQRQAEEAAWLVRKAASDAEAARCAAIKTDPLRVDLLQRIKTATNAQISTYVDSNVTDLASAKTLFKKILLLIALDQRNGG